MAFELFLVDPEVVFNGINTRITLFATSIQVPFPPDAVTIVPTGMSAPITPLMFNTVTNHPNRLQAIVPIGLAPGLYDVMLKDYSGSFATLPKALSVTNDLTVTLKSVTPPFGATAGDAAIMISRDTAALAPADKPFVETPRVFLNPTNPMVNDVAVELRVAFVDGDKATCVVPAGTPVHDYDVVLVNPDGSVGLLKEGYREVQNAPPVILTATPSSIVSGMGGQNVVLGGKNFDAMDVVTLACVDAAGNPVPTPNVTSTPPVSMGEDCTQRITIDGSTLGAGDVCVVRVTNPDTSYGEYSAIGVTTPSLNLSLPRQGTDMNVGRRALAAASGDATTGARFVYAIGGDSGTADATMDSTEFASVDVFGNIGAWTLQKASLNAKRTLSGATIVGRYIYLVGGEDGTGPVDSAERALILSPRETPVIDDIDLDLGTKGLDAGTWHYRVSATFDATDSDNPGGESLPSDEFTIKLPAFPNKKIEVTLFWKAPVDSLGEPLAGISGYRIYRTAKAGDPPGSEQLLATVNELRILTFSDDGTAATMADETPLPEGSTGAWSNLPAMTTKRSGAAVVAAFDPMTPTKFYVYALLGKSSTAAAVTSYEFLPVTIAPNGRQTVGDAWTAGASAFGSARWQVGAWVVDKTVDATYGTDTWIFVGGGLGAAGATDNRVEAGKVAAGGDLGVISDTPKDYAASSAGYGVCAANGQLFSFGGLNAAPSGAAKSASLIAPAPTLAGNSWSDEGLTMMHGRYLLGSSVQSAFIFLLGGQTDEPSPASKTTELVIW